MTKKNILFIPAPIWSHFIPSFYLAHHLSKDFSIYYLTNDPATGEMIELQKFNPIYTNTLRIGIGLERIFFQKGGKIAKELPLKLFFKNKLYKARKNELKKLVQNLQPHAIFVDIYSSTDFLLLFPFRRLTKILMFNPMLSTYAIAGMPLVNHGDWNTTIYPSQSFIDLLKKQMSKYGKASTFQVYKEYIKNKVYKTNKLSLDNPFVYLFDNVPELILAPQEIELSQSMKKHNQHYLGLNIHPERIETAIDKEFETSFQEIINLKQKEGKKILYCCFGTYFVRTQEYKAITSFLLAMIESFRQCMDLQVVLSINEQIQNAVKKLIEIPEHFFMFNKVNQIKVLQYADAFITHGGLGSVKEAIYYKVPMLVYPLDMNWDQNGNGLKVEYHKIGLRGDINDEEPEDIYRKVQELLTNKIYRENITEFNQKFQLRYTKDALDDLLSNLLENPVGNCQKIISGALVV